MGRTLTMDGKAVEIVGVVADTRYRAVNEPFRPVVYLPFDQFPQGRFFIHARIRGGGETLAALDRAARSVDPRIVVDRAIPLAAWLDDMRAPEFVGVAEVEPATGIPVILALAAVAAAAAFMPARRVARVDPILALRAE